MNHVPAALMLDRLNAFGTDSDSALLHELLYAGEFILKLSVATLVAGLDDDNDSHRYRLLHSLVRANGIGDWAKALDDMLTGPASQHLSPSFRDTRNAITSLHRQNTWQHNVVSHTIQCLNFLSTENSPIPQRLSIRHWYPLFVELRNKTRGHGAPTPAICAKLAAHLRLSVDYLYKNIPLLELPWAYLHRNLSGKYQVTPLTLGTTVFDHLKTSSAINGPHYPNGIYIFSNRPRIVELISSDLDARDFFFPNGNFSSQYYDLHSLISDNRTRGDAKPYLAPVGARPSSESEGKTELDHIGRVLTNIPSAPAAYVRRPSLQSEVYEALMDDRHPIVTLAGRGGIGKTSLVLHLLHELALHGRYDLIIWFSARDIDLTLSGPKLVRPHLLTERDLDREYRSLVGAAQSAPGGDGADSDSLATAMYSQPIGTALYVFDNFETVRDPVDLYHWIDNNIRLPNKVVITTRFRDFRADLPIMVSGMERGEAEILIDQTARSLGIEEKIQARHVEEIIEQSDGHPYIIKILLGEIADNAAIGRPQKILARKEDILDALFERTYQNLSPVAERILLTLSRWRSLVPQLATEAMLLRHDHNGEHIDPEAAIDQLVRMSFVERVKGEDGSDFLRVPLTAALFCKRKLDVSREHALIEEDFRFLNDFGATAVTSRNPDFGGRMAAFFRRTARKVTEGNVEIESVRRIVEFFGRNYSSAWLLMADMEEEFSGAERAAECVRRYLELAPGGSQAGRAWRRLAGLYQRSGDALAACSAFLRSATLLEPSLEEISRVANSVNGAAQLRDRMDIGQRRTVLEPLAELLEAHSEYASATDLSRLAWLYLHSGDRDRALTVVEQALSREPDNIHCLRLHSRLSEG